MVLITRHLNLGYSPIEKLLDIGSSLQANLTLRLDCGERGEPLVKALLSKLWLQHRLQISVCPLNPFLCSVLSRSVSEGLHSCVISEQALNECITLGTQRYFCKCTCICLHMYSWVLIAPLTAGLGFDSELKAGFVCWIKRRMKEGREAG